MAPLTGRDPLIGQLLDSLEQVNNRRQGRFVLVDGEAGFGKSRLARELTIRLENQGQQPIVGRAFADKRAVSYWLLTDILSQLFGFDPKMDGSQRRERLLDFLEKQLGRKGIARTAPSLLWMLGLANQEELQEMEGMEPERRQQRLFRNIQAIFLTVTDTRPLVLLVDDAQWMDAASIDCLIHLMNRRAMLPFLMVIFSRPRYQEEGEEEHALSRLVDAHAPDHTFNLQPLAHSDAYALLTKLLGWDEIPEPLRAAVLKRAQGIPFLIEELARNLVEHGALYFQGQRWQFNQERVPSSALLPATVRGTVMKRLHRLAKPARLLLELAAIIGTRLERAVLIDAAGKLGYPWDDDEPHSMLALLVERGFLVEEGEAHVRFRHNLVQETSVFELIPRQRERYHRAIATALEQIYAGQLDNVVERLALHYSQTGEAAKAIPYLIEAGSVASERCASEQAIYYYQTALEKFPDQVAGHPDLFLSYGRLVAALGRNEEAREIFKQGLAESDAAHASRFHYEIGMVYGNLAAFEEAEKTLWQAFREAEAQDEPFMATIFNEIGWLRFHQGRLDEANELYEQALTLLRYGVPKERASVLNRQAGIAFRRGDLDRAHELILRAMDGLAELGDLAGLAKSHTNLGSIYMQQGNFEQAIDHQKQAQQISERLGDASGQVAVLLNLTLCLNRVGQFREALPVAERGLAYARETGQRYHESLALSHLGWIHANLRDLEKGCAFLEQSRDIADEIGATARYQVALLQLAEVLFFNQAYERAEEIVEMLFAGDQLQQYLGELYRVRAALAAHKGELEEASRLISSSLELIDPDKDPVSRLYTELAQISILMKLGRELEAQQKRRRALQRWQQTVRQHAGLPPLLEVNLQKISQKAPLF